MTAALRADGVSLGYARDAADVVADLSLAIEDGQVTTIVGPNGCGKSTLLRAFGNLLRPHTGAIILDGASLSVLPTKAAARRVALMRQQPAEPTGVTVESLVARGRYPHQGFLQSATDRDRGAVDRALALTGIQHLRARDLETLSGGQRHRVWLALALAQQTDILLLDEPTTYLDPAHREEVLGVVRQIADDGVTVVLVLHDVNEAARVSDRVVVMRDGRVVRECTPEELMDADLLGSVYDIGFDIVPHPLSGASIAVPVSEVVDFAPVPPRGVIEVRGLTTGHRSDAVVSRDLDLDLPLHAISCIVGPNASGKSTLLLTAARLLPALAGSVRIDGVDTRQGTRRSLARRLGVVQQGMRPPAGFSVADVVLTGRNPRQRSWRQWSAEDEEMVDGALDAMGISDLRDRDAGALSGGQLQRVLIARALAQDTPVLFLDEPTTFLDPGHQIELLDLIHRLNREHGRTVVMVLHDLHLGARYADHIVAVKDGRVAARGAPDEVLTPQTVSDVFGVDTTVTTDPRTGRPLVLSAPTREEG
ncbi:ABC transporter ATP-binding protein [Microbacterium sp. NPDC089189]|uniref:ABC transporter ATP-binding protein n=1 Tax=Microbacterium sp. NPDC089189 TaxID=3154972 RepID=UPI00343767DA